jgi:hypothetical protein
MFERAYAGTFLCLQKDNGREGRKGAGEKRASTVEGLV